MVEAEGARALLSVALSQAENNDYIPSNPVKKVQIPVNPLNLVPCAFILDFLALIT
jgi:hypothetical protein